MTITCDYEDVVPDGYGMACSEPGVPTSIEVNCNNVATHILYQPLEDQMHDEYALGDNAEESITMFLCEDHIVEQVHEARQCVGPDEAVFVIKIDSIEQVN